MGSTLEIAQSCKAVPAEDAICYLADISTLQSAFFSTGAFIKGYIIAFHSENRMF